MHFLEKGYDYDSFSSTIGLLIMRHAKYIELSLLVQLQTNQFEKKAARLWKKQHRFSKKYILRNKPEAKMFWLPRPSPAP